MTHKYTIVQALNNNLLISQHIKIKQFLKHNNFTHQLTKINETTTHNCWNLNQLEKSN